MALVEVLVPSTPGAVYSRGTTVLSRALAMPSHGTGAPTIGEVLECLAHSIGNAEQGSAKHIHNMLQAKSLA